MNDSSKVAVVKKYFELVDAGQDPGSLFTDDVQFYYPKFGLSSGRAAFGEFVVGIMGTVKSIVHPVDSFRFVEQGDTVVVEGHFNGETIAGTRWNAGATPTGRFCSVFQFRNDRVVRMHIYVDPDYGSTNAAGFLWGRDRHW